MVSSFYRLFQEVNFYDYHNLLINSQYYELIFPFLLIYAVLYSALIRIKIFRSKKTQEPLKSVVSIVSLIVSLYGVKYETSAGYSVGSLLMMMFPNVSAITIGTLCLYIVGSLFGKNFFYGIFRKDIDAFAYYAVGAVGLGAVVFYTGIVMGFWDLNPMSQQSYWNVVFAVAFLVLGCVFAFIGSFPLAFIFLFVFLSYVFSSSNGSILELFIDPFVFIVLIIGVLLTWLGSDSDSRTQLAKEIRSQERLIDEYDKTYGGKYPNYRSRIYDVSDVHHKENKKRWERLFPNDKEGWRK